MVWHMSECSFCGKTDEKEYPLCQSCGALRYPIEKKRSDKAAANQYQKLKISAAVAAAIVTPGGFVVLAVMGANQLSEKIKNRHI